MKVIKIAVESGRWDLAAHVIVLAAAKQLEKGRKIDGEEAKTKKRGSKG